MLTSITIADALQKLDKTNDKHWNADGTPLLTTVRFLTSNMTLSQEELDDVSGSFNRNPPETSVSTSTEKEPEQIEIFTISARNRFEKEQDSYHELLIKQDNLIKEIAEKALELQELSSIAEAEDGIVTNQDTIISYLESQKRNLQARANKLVMIKDSGVDLKQLMADLKSPLDASYSRRARRSSNV